MNSDSEQSINRFTEADLIEIQVGVNSKLVKVGDIIYRKNEVPKWQPYYEVVREELQSNKDPIKQYKYLYLVGLQT